MTAAKNSSELVPVTPEANLPAIQQQWASEFDSEMSKGGFNLPQIGIAKDIQQFIMPPADAAVKTFRGIYLGEVRYNILFPPKEDGKEQAKELPICVSRDGVHGSKERTILEGVTDVKSGEISDKSAYGTCASCWFNQFGSGKEGAGKACQNKSTMMIWPLGMEAVVPYLINLPVTSLTFRVVSAPLGISIAGSEIRAAMPVLKAPPTAIEAEFYLEKQQKGSWVWSTLRAKVIGTVSNDDYARCSAFAKKYMPWLSEKATEADSDLQDAEVIDDAIGY